MTKTQLTRQNMALWSCAAWWTGTCARYSVWSETSSLPGLLSWIKAKSKTCLLSSVELRHYPRAAAQPAACLSAADSALQPLRDVHEAAVTPDPATHDHLLQFYLSICSYGITLHLSSPFGPPGPQLPSTQLRQRELYLQRKKLTGSKTPRPIWLNIWFVSSHLSHRLKNPSLSHVLRSCCVDFSRKKRVCCRLLKEAASPLM